MQAVGPRSEEVAVVSSVSEGLASDAHRVLHSCCGEYAALSSQLASVQGVLDQRL